MLLMPNKKKMATMIIAGMGPKKPDFVQKLGEESNTGEFKTPEGDDEASAGPEASMESLMSAIGAKDAKAGLRAFKELMAQLDDDDEPEEPMGGDEP